MGLFFSRANGYTSVLMMNTDNHLHFAKELRDQRETARAVGQMQTLAQMQATSGPGGKYAGSFAGTMTNWIWLAGLIKTFAPIMIVTMGAGAGITYAAKWSAGIMFATTFISTFFFFFFIQSITTSQYGNIASGMTFWISLGMSLVTSFVVSFVVYDPNEGKSVQNNDIRNNANNAYNANNANLGPYYGPRYAPPIVG